MAVRLVQAGCRYADAQVPSNRLGKVAGDASID
jgi:hypothetical protein